ncbi:DUF5129 domain-containing protein [Zafaria cholistanensis]|uniref:DUF5129 domain-containing protein n=1 Tax=Zafaria cholistanensis TaxID=1682741 RepID=UPI00155A4919|nr:DUF5129 domain-containing protein [Zafaria cholistanensis]
MPTSSSDGAGPEPCGSARGDANARSRRKAVRKGERFEELALSLDGLDDALAQANHRLSMSSRWRQAWRAQSAGLREDLGGRDPATAGGHGHHVRGRHADQAGGWT